MKNMKTLAYVIAVALMSGVVESVAAQTAAEIATTPYAAWKLDDGSGTAAADSSGNNLTASLFNGPAWLPATQCIAGGCLSFNGTTQYGSVALNLSDTTAVTVSFWLKWNAYAKDDKLALEFGSGAAGFNNLATGFMIDPNSSYQDGTTFEAGLRGNGGYNQVLFTRPSAGVWHHYAFVLNKANPAATEVIPYVDGVAVAYTKPTSSENSNGFGADTLYLMSRNGTSLFGAGALDDVRIYKRPLPASEIAAQASLAYATTPYAALKLDDGSGTAAADSSGNNLTTSLFNGPAWLPATQCIAGGCLSFNGTTQYGSVALNLSDTTAVTVSFWLKWNAYAKDDKLRSNSDQRYFGRSRLQ